MCKRIDFPCDELRELYENQKLTTRQIGNKFNVSGSVIVRNLKFYGIRVRTNGEDKKGKPSWNTGRKMSESTRRKLCGNFFKKGHSSWNKGLGMDVPTLVKQNLLFSVILTKILPNKNPKIIPAKILGTNTIIFIIFINYHGFTNFYSFLKTFELV